MAFQLTPIQQAEMAAMMALVPNSLLSIKKIADGPWSDKTKWMTLDGSASRIPRAGDFVCLDGFQTDIDAVFNDPPTGICACGGGTVLNFLPDRNTGLSFVSLIGVTDSTGVPTLQIGTQAAPIQSPFTAALTIAGRGPVTAAMQAYDVKDMSGCLMWTGTMRGCGAIKTPYALPSAAVNSGVSSIPMVMVPPDWAVGDLLLFVGPGGHCETRHLVAPLSATAVNLDSPLSFPHGSYKALRDMGAKGIGLMPNVLGLGPVCNLTNNVTVQSAVVNDLTQRGHFMSMFSMDVNCQNMTFIDLGRTNALVAHTKPWKGNTIGRYAGVHIHCRNGDLNAPTTWATTPATVTRCHVYGTTQPLPKHSHDNHGGYVNFTECISHNLQGTLFTENGSEIGSFRRCLTSTTSGDVKDAQDTRVTTGPGTGVPEDRAFQGHMLWLASGGVEATDCQGWGNANGVGVYCLPDSYDMSETEFSWFLAENVTVPASAGMERPPVDPSTVILLPTPDPNNGLARTNTRCVAPYVARCYCNGPNPNNGYGLFSYNETFPGCSVAPLNVQIHLDHGGIAWSDSYTDAAVMHDFYFCGADTDNDIYPSAGYCFSGMTQTRNLTVKNGTIEGYISGPRIYGIQGAVVFDTVTFKNVSDLFFEAPFDGSVTLKNLSFPAVSGPFWNRSPKKGNIFLDNTIPARPDEDPSGGTLPPFDSYFGWSDTGFAPFNFTIDGQFVVYDCQAPGFIPFPTTLTDTRIPKALIGLTNAQMVAQYGMQIGGCDMTTAWGSGYSKHPNITSGGGILAALGPACTGRVPPSKVGTAPMAPVAAFSAMPVMGQVPLAVQFTDQSTNMPTSWMWDFGDGNTSMMQNPSHVYSVAGTYAVKLTATNGAGSNAISKMNLITAAVQMTMVPDVVTGLNSAESNAFAQAMQTAKGAGLSISLPATHVYTQSPGVGTSASVGSTIIVN